jgi:hypothetical protein
MCRPAQHLQAWLCSRKGRCLCYLHNAMGSKSIRDSITRTNCHANIPEKGSRSFLAKNSGEGIGNARVVSTLLWWQGGVVGHAHEGDLTGAADKSSNAAGHGASNQTRPNISWAVLGHFITKHLEQAETGGGIENLSEQSRRQSVIQTHETLVSNLSGREAEERRGCSSLSTGHGVQVHAHREGVERMHDNPAHHTSQPGCGEIGER